MSCLLRSRGVTPESRVSNVHECERDTYGKSRQRHLAVHPHVALHLPLQMFLGGELVRRNAIAGVGRRDGGSRWGEISRKVNYPIGCQRLKTKRLSRKRRIS